MYLSPLVAQDASLIFRLLRMVPDRWDGRPRMPILVDAVSLRHTPLRAVEAVYSLALWCELRLVVLRRCSVPG